MEARQSAVQEWHPIGVDGAHGTLEVAPLGAEDLLRRMADRMNLRDTAIDADSDDLGTVGWGVLLAEDEDSEILKALEPLLALRREQAGRLFREEIYRGEEPTRFLRNLGVAPGPADPDRLPYYLLIVGSPERIPFELQFELDLQRAVGRIVFDSPGAYGRYARAVVAAETRPTRSPGISIFAVGNEDDDLTKLSIDCLAKPLGDELRSRSDWPLTSILGAEASKHRLGELFVQRRGDLLFTASHSVRFPAGHPRQRGEQGALLCADWPGPQRWRGAIPPDFLFTGADVPAEADVAGLVAFFFACYSAGTPYRDLFERPIENAPIRSPVPFVGDLPGRLMDHPAGSALAIVGHIDQTFESSFLWPGAGKRVETFASALLGLTYGQRLGHALEVFARRYAEISSEIAERLWRVPESSMSATDRRDLSRLWQAFQDARAYVILGDPAVRLGQPRGQS